MNNSTPSAGDVYRVGFPFVRCEHHTWDEEGEHTVPSWRPGVEFRNSGPYGEDVEAIAHGEGEMTLTVVGVFKPGRFPTRVFYTRQFTSPDGNSFGKSRLLIATVEKFRRISARYAHLYEVEDVEPQP